MNRKSMMKRQFLLIAWMAIGMIAFETALAADWYVSLDGQGQGKNGWADATNDLQGAIDASSALDTVWVSNGVYQTGGAELPRRFHAV